MIFSCTNYFSMLHGVSGLFTTEKIYHQESKLVLHFEQRNLCKRVRNMPRFPFSEFLRILENVVLNMKYMLYLFSNRPICQVIKISCMLEKLQRASRSSLCPSTTFPSDLWTSEVSGRSDKSGTSVSKMSRPFYF